MTLLLIDTSIFLHKSIYVEQYDGDPVWTFFDHIKDLKVISKADEVIFTFDGTKPTFRHKMFSGYKAQRPEKTEEFKQFKDYIEDRIRRNYLYEFQENYESDDLIGSHAVKYKGRVFIGSTDLDLSQLVNDRVTMLKPRKGKWTPEVHITTGYENITPSYVINRYGVSPDQIPDFKALSGDSSDNYKLPIKGMGQVAAAKLLIIYDSLEGIYEHIDDEDFILPKFRDSLKENKDQAFFFKKLATIRTDCELLNKL